MPEPGSCSRWSASRFRNQSRSAARQLTAATTKKDTTYAAAQLVVPGVTTVTDGAMLIGGVGLVELEEGPWLHAQLDVDPDAVAVGQALSVRFEQPEGGEAIPVFEPA